MFLFRKIKTLQKHIKEKRKEGFNIGFVPTMGALHIGHGALISHSKTNGLYTVVSIYVNPTQFNDPEDLKKYPRPISKDMEYLHELGCDVLFLPPDEEIYPDEEKNIPGIELGHLNTTLEAAYRPGHFEGVIQVMNQLLEIVAPDYLFMGMKDLQQLTIIGLLIREAGFSTNLVGLPIEREPHGLARSSRNERLSPDNRNRASIIHQSLVDTADQYKNKSHDELKTEALEKLNQQPFRPEYFEFVQANNLKIVKRKEDYDGAISVVTAVWCGDIRLIDNMEMPVQGPGVRGR